MLTYVVLALCISNIAGSVINIYNAHREASLGRRYVGWSSAIVSTAVLITYLQKSISQPDFVFNNSLLDTRSILLWSMFSNLLFLYPLLEYRADLISKKLFIKILHPTLILGILFFSLYWIDIEYTELITWNDLVANVSLHDVQFRLFLMLATVVISITYLYIPFILPRVDSEPHVRKFSKWYYAFFIFGNFLIVFYIIFSLVESPFFIVVFRMLLLLLLNAITYSYMIPNVSLTRLRKGAISRKTYTQPYSADQEDHVVELYDAIHEEIKQQQYYLNPSISIDELAKQLRTTRQVIVEVIAKKEFNGYYEYLNAFRVNHFKELAQKLPKIPISELYSQSGFASQVSFYRIFQQMESCTPEEFMEKLESGQISALQIQ